MAKWLIDTNVPIVANGRTTGDSDREPSLSCREACVRFLLDVSTNHRVLIDFGGEVLAEYRRYLKPSGQPGVGDRFYNLLLRCSPERVRRVDLQKNDIGEFESLPLRLVEIGFDPSDRKFAAMSVQEQAPVANATDSDWVNDAEELAAAGVRVHHLCGCDCDRWFAE